MVFHAPRSGRYSSLREPTPEPEKKAQDIQKYDLGEIEETPPPQLDVDPTLEKPKTEAHEEEVYDDSKVFEHRGGGSNKGADIAGGGAGVLAFGSGPKLSGPQGIGQGLGEGKEYGKGGAGNGFGGRGSGSRKKSLASGGGTVRTERAVTAALLWLAHHQNYSEGNWSMENFTAQCKPGDKSCTGVGDVPGCDAGATAMGLLPFLPPARRTNRNARTKTTSPKASVAPAKSAGRRQSGQAAHQMMYSHGLATIALSEAYGLSGDKQVGQAAQRAVDFILAAQNKTDGGWRYMPGEAGDTFGSRLAIDGPKQPHMAGLSFSPGVFQQTSKWLDSVAVHDGTEYSYQPGVQASADGCRGCSVVSISARTQ